MTLKHALEKAHSMGAAPKQAEYLNLSKLTASGDQGEEHVMTGGMAQNFGNKPKFININQSSDILQHSQNRHNKQQFQRYPSQGKPLKTMFWCGGKDNNPHSCKKLRTKLVTFAKTEDTHQQCVEGWSAMEQ